MQEQRAWWVQISYRKSDNKPTGSLLEHLRQFLQAEKGLDFRASKRATRLCWLESRKANRWYARNSSFSTCNLYAQITDSEPFGLYITFQVGFDNGYLLRFLDQAWECNWHNSDDELEGNQERTQTRCNKNLGGTARFDLAESCPLKMQEVTPLMTTQEELWQQTQDSKTKWELHECLRQLL